MDKSDIELYEQAYASLHRSADLYTLAWVDCIDLEKLQQSILFAGEAHYFMSCLEARFSRKPKRFRK
jgi:hypothetical protein